jgi:carbamoylphosphate synthase large subunit
VSAVVVTGVGGPAGSALALELARAGVPVLGVDMRPVRVAGIETARVPAVAEPRFARELLRRARRFGATTLIPTVSEELPVLARLRDRGRWPGPELLLASRPSIELAADKWRTCAALADAGIPVPRFALVAELEGGQHAARLLGTPFLSKPRVGRGGRGVEIHRVGIGAQGDAPRVFAAGDAAILQEFVPGDEYSVNLHLDADRSNAIAVVLRKTALRQGSVGNAIAVERVAAGDVARVAIDAARVLGLCGPLDVDVRRRATGEPVVLELNARVGANCGQAPELIEALVARCAPAAGIPIAA